MNDKKEKLDETVIVKPNNKNKRTLLLILVVSIAPLALAYFSFFTGIGVPDNTASFGNIINPALQVESLLAENQQTAYDDMQRDKKWHLFIPVSEQCDASCEQILYLTRQVHIRLGDKGARIDRTAINFGGANGEAYLSSIQSEHPRLKVLTVDKHVWNNWLDQSPSLSAMRDKPFYLLVDQEGFAMMTYSLDVDGGNLLKDLKRALRHSIDYQ